MELSRRLVKEGISSQYLNLDYSMFQSIPKGLKEKLGKPLVPLAEAKTSHRHYHSVIGWFTNIISSLLLIMTLLFHFFDGFVQYFFRVKPLIRQKMVIHDRYFYDYAILYLDICPRWLLWCFRRLLPPPELTILLNVSPEVAHSRDGEYKPDFYRRQARRYLAFLQRLDKKKVYICNADHSREEVISLILNRVLALIKEEKQ